MASTSFVHPRYPKDLRTASDWQTEITAARKSGKGVLHFLVIGVLNYIFEVGENNYSAALGHCVM